MYYNFIDNKKNKNIILIHSIPSSSKLFKEHIPILSKKYNILLVDLPGFGKSYEMEKFNLEDILIEINNIIKNLNLKKLDIWGISLGGTVALGISTILRINKLILESTPIYYGDIHTNEFKAVFKLEKLLKRFNLINIFPKLLKNSKFIQSVIIMVYKLINRKRFTLPKDQLKQFVNEININPFFDAIRYLTKFDNRKILKNYNSKIVLIFDKRDVVVDLNSELFEKKNIKFLEYNWGIHAPSAMYGKVISNDFINL